MKIELSTQEFRDLLDILHIADIILSGHRREKDPRTERHRALIQQLYARSLAEGFDRLFNYDAGAQNYIPAREFEESTLAHALIDEFGDHLFWDELISRLSARDTAQMAGGIERLNALAESNRQQLEGPVRQRYIEEFSLHGVDNLDVVERFSFGRGTAVKTSD